MEDKNRIEKALPFAEKRQLGREVSLEEASREWIKRYSARFRRLYW